MSLLTQVSEEAVEEERKIQQQIYDAIDQYKNIIFNAGAGAGKTYALIESLKYIIENKGKQLNRHNQNIICITYTNVATNEIRERLGNSKLVKVSTIHERLWDLIKDYQKQLVEIHKDKLNEEIKKLNSELDTEKKFYKYQSLDDKNNFIEIMIEHKDEYNQNKYKSAAEFKTAIKTFLNDNEKYYGLLSNVSYFKALVRKIYQIKDYKECLIKIENGEYKKVTYDARFNNDRLHKMLISHDTLLDYADKIIEKYKRLRQIIIDKYPYILIDEFQDTDEKVINILKNLSDYSQEINHNLFIGYFGDTAQNIYDTGVGSKIFELHPNLENIAKLYNRRSANEIIEVINKIRNDEIVQESIYSDADGGSVKFYHGSQDSINNFVDSYKTEWNISSNNKLHCLVLTNELVAKYNGFGNFYKSLKNTPYFKSNWQNVTTEILSQDLSKLGTIPNLFYRIIDFKEKIKNPKTLIVDLINEKIYKKLTFKQLKELINKLKSINTDGSFEQFIESIFQIYNNTNDENYKKIIEDIFELENYTLDGFVSFLLNKLFLNIREEEIEELKVKIIEMLEVDYNEYKKWFNFINKKEENDVIYHTYHGTKGEEYENVMIIMQNDFGRDKNKFSSFFKNYGNKLEGDELEKFTNTRNLLYVSCSRAIKNLRIFYLDDISEFKDGIESIFGVVEKFEIKN